MRTVLRTCTVLLAFGIATTASDARTRAGGADCAPSPSRPLVVTNFSDNVDHPAKGTLRNILLDVVKPGQEVTFCDTTPIDLAGSLSIPSNDRAVTISGGAISAPELRPTTFDIKATGLRIVGTSFYEVRVVVEAGDVTLTHDTFRQRHAGEEDLILAHRASGLKIGGPGADQDTFDSYAKDAISVQYSDEVSIVGNTITTHGGGRFAVVSFASHKFTLTNNTTDGDVISLAQSGTISHNTLNGPAGAGAAADSVASGKKLTPAEAIAAARASGLGLYVLTEGSLPVGTMKIEHNHVNNAALDVERPNVTIGSNVVTGGSGMGVTCGHPDEPSRAPIAIVHNELTGTAKGLRYRCLAAVKATLDNNTLKGGKQYGIFVDAPRASLRANTVQENGRKGIFAGCPNGAPAGSLELTGNIVTGNGTGVTLACDAATVATTITGGKVQGNHGVGIRVLPGAHATISRVAMGGNAGPGIESGAVPPPVLKYSGQKVRGATCGACVVEAFAVESGARAGNEHNGEGTTFRGVVHAGGNGRFVYPASCDDATGTVRLTFTATKGEGATAGTSGFSTDATCKPPFYNVYVHVTFNNVCKINSDSQKITDPVDSTPVEYYFYLTLPPPLSCPRVGTQSYSVANADALKAAEKAEAAAKPTKPETESAEEDWGKSPLNIPAFEPDTTIYATHLQTCSESDPHPTVPYHYAPPCGTGTRVVVEVINHQPNG